MWKARFYQALPSIVETFPKSRWLFLTLTVRNCDIHDLSRTLDAMNKAWGRLVNRKEFGQVQGWIRTTEVTRGKDNSAHPHFHALLMVAPSYFSGRNYVAQARWSEIWQSCLRVDYAPVVDVRTVKSRANSDDDPASMLRDAVSETLKYSVKTSDLIADDAWMIEYTRQVHRKRFIASGGVLKDVLREYEESNEDLIIADNDNEAGQISKHLLAFEWRKRDKHYLRAPHRDTIAE